jgi:hypothetical protein
LSRGDDDVTFLQAFDDFDAAAITPAGGDEDLLGDERG